MAESDRKVRVFYSWQSDSPKKTNLFAIRDALEKAAKRISAAMPGVNVIPDEATRDTSGGPNIILKILEKIDEADVFIADITTITLPGSSLACPNPNVVYELGYAVAQLGWDRIILLFNKALGKFPDDLPFDFVQNRASPYELGEADPKTTHAGLIKLIETAVEAVIKKNPKRPAELRGLTREKIQHDHDVENLIWLMSAIHLPTLDQHILDLPHSISDRALWFFENVRGIVVNSLFKVYDPVLSDAIDRFFTAWSTALSHDDQYNDTPSGRIHIFRNPGDMPLPPHRQAIWDEIDASRREMRHSLDQILERLRDGYLEVNLQKTSALAWKDYVNCIPTVKGGLHRGDTELP